MFKALFIQKRAYSQISGLTLIEILVVTAIIAVLAYITTVVAVRVKMNARQTVCVSNLASLGKAMYLYAGDHDDQLPTLTTFSFEHVNGEPGTADCTGLQNSYALYGINPAGWKCPLDNDPSRRGTVYFNECPDVCSYATSIETVLVMEPLGNTWQLRLSKVENPATRPYLHDTYWSDDANQFKSAHGSEHAVLFFDGHVQRAKPLPAR